jgi:cystathionine gamma-synthase
MVWVETPSNPLLRVTDLARTAETCRRVGALLVADNTFLSPALQRPLALGADLVLHSTTKYLNGHSDVVGGVVVAGSVELAEELDWWSNCLGLAGAPFDSFLTLRGLRTLHVRWAQHLANATQVVDALLAHPAVSKVHYPGLSTHPGHAVACRQQSGFGAIVSFELGGGRPAVAELVAAVRLFTLAESLGGFESLVAHPASMTHASMTAQERARAGIDESLLRLSVGIEHGPDLVSDLVQALDQSRSSLARTG